MLLSKPPPAAPDLVYGIDHLDSHTLCLARSANRGRVGGGAVALPLREVALVRVKEDGAEAVVCASGAGPALPLVCRGRPACVLARVETRGIQEGRALVRVRRCVRVELVHRRQVVVRHGHNGGRGILVVLLQVEHVRERRRAHPSVD